VVKIPHLFVVVVVVFFGKYYIHVHVEIDKNCEGIAQAENAADFIW